MSKIKQVQQDIRKLQLEYDKIEQEQRVRQSKITGKKLYLLMQKDNKILDDRLKKYR